MFCVHEWNFPSLASWGLIFGLGNFFSQHNANIMGKMPAFIFFSPTFRSRVAWLPGVRPRMENYNFFFEAFPKLAEKLKTTAKDY